jgi:hypothetical protein
MSRAHQIDRAVRRAATRDRKRIPRMHVSGKGVFGLQKLLRKRK